MSDAENYDWDDTDFNPATMKNGEIYVGTRKYVAVGKVRDEITALRARLAEVEAANRGLVRLNEATEARAERAEAALATARRDALEEAATLADGFMVDMMNAALSGLPEQARLREAMANTAERIRIAIRALKDTLPQPPCDV